MLELNFTNFEQAISSWLLMRPEQSRLKEANAISYRAVNRALPYIGRGDGITAEQNVSVILAGLWSVLVLKLSALRSNESLVEAANSAAGLVRQAGENAASGDDAMLGAYAAAAQGLDSFIGRFHNSHHPGIGGGVAFAQITLNRAHDFDSEPSMAFWVQMSDDISKLENGLSATNLILSPLWSSVHPLWVKECTQFLELLASSDMSGFGFDIWSEWYRTTCAGEPVFGIEDFALAERLEYNIALGGRDGGFHPEFWQRNPATINANIKRWLEKARAAEAEPHAKTTNEELDLTSRPASIQTTTSHGKVVLEIEQPDADVARDLLAAAVLDLQNGLRRLEALARQKNAPETLLSFFNEISKTIATAHIDQSKLFECGRNLKTLQGYGSTVTEEWDSFAAAQYHALVLQFDEVIKKFPDWRNFASHPPKAKSGTTVEDVASAVDEVAEAIFQQPDIVAATIGVRLKALAFSLKTATRRAAEQVAFGGPGNIATELLMSDAAQSVANTLMSLVKLGLENVAPSVTQFGGTVSEGAGQGVVYIVAAVTTALALPAIPKLAKMFPGVFDRMKEGAKILRDLWSDK